MSTYHTGVDYIWTYSGILKMVEGVLNISLIIFSIVLGSTFQTNFLIGLSTYALISVIILLIIHVRGYVRNINFTWCWAELMNSAILVILFFISATLVIIVLTKGCIITGVIGYITVLVYCLDSIEKLKFVRTPRSRYVWTTPNMPELT